MTSRNKPLSTAETGYENTDRFVTYVLSVVTNSITPQIQISAEHWSWMHNSKWRRLVLDKLRSSIIINMHVDIPTLQFMRPTTTTPMLSFRRIQSSSGIESFSLWDTIHSNNEINNLDN